MNIISTDYSPATNSFDVYVAGCNPPHCPGCFNPETWDFQQGRLCDEVYIQEMIAKIQEFDLLIERVLIMGGEPLDQEPESLLCLLHAIRATGKSCWVFTKYPLQQVPDAVKHACDYLKCGRYDRAQLVGDYVSHGIRLASANQKIYQMCPAKC